MTRTHICLAACISLLHCAAKPRAADLNGQKLLVTSIRTGDTEVFLADPSRAT